MKLQTTLIFLITLLLIVFNIKADKVLQKSAEYRPACGCDQIIYYNAFEANDNFSIGSYYGVVESVDSDFPGAKKCNSIKNIGGAFATLTFSQDIVRCYIKGRYSWLTGLIKTETGKRILISAEYKAGGDWVRMETIERYGNSNWENFDYYFDFSDRNTITELRILVSAPSTETAVLIDNISICNYCRGYSSAEGPLLSGVELSHGEFVTPFTPTKSKHLIKLNQETNSFNIKPILNSADSEIKIYVNGELLRPQPEDLTIVDGSTVNVIVEKSICEKTIYLFSFVIPVNNSANADLVTLNAEQVDCDVPYLDRMFSSRVLDYILYVDNFDEDIIITPSPADENATIFINGNLLINESTDPINIDFHTKIEITVTAKDNKTKKTYILIPREKIFEPVVTIVKPTSRSSFTTASNLISVSGTATRQSISSVVSYTLKGATTGSGNATGASEWEIKNLNLNEGVSELTVTASNSGGHKGFATLIIIYEKNPIVNFKINSLTNDEFIHNPQIDVVISPALTGDKTVFTNYSVTSGTANSNYDYLLSHGILKFDASHSTLSIPLIIFDDCEDELDENLVITLSPPTNGAVLGHNPSFTYTIIDNDEQSDMNSSTLFVRANITVQGNGCSWNNAYKYLKDALSAARASNGLVKEIRVAAGTYYPDESNAFPTGTDMRTESFELNNGVKLIGGYPNNGGDNSIPGTYPTMLSGDIDHEDGGSSNNAQNARHVVIGANCDIEGIVIREGNADSYQDNGAGLYGSNITLTIKKCEFINNQSNYYGAGIYVSDGTLTLQECKLTNNTILTDGYGSGAAIFGINTAMYIYTTDFRANEIRQAHDENFEGSGGAIAQYYGKLIIEGPCTFEDNIALDGGAISVSNEFTVKNTIFSGNHADGDGGAIEVFNGAAININNCKLIYNWAGNNGGALFLKNITTDGQFSIINSAFLGNVGSSNAGAIYSNNLKSLSILFSTFVKNISYTGTGGAIFCQNTNTNITNSILWHNGPTLNEIYRDIYSDIDGTLNVTYTDIQQNGFTGNSSLHNKQIIPKFFNSSPVIATDLRLLSDSECRNSANTTSGITIDIDGKNRGNAPDMGAYEYDGSY